MPDKTARLDAHFAAVRDWRAEVLALRALLLTTPLTENFKWRAPVYTWQGANVCIIWGFRDRCTLGFFKGVLLTDPEGILNTPGPNSRSSRTVDFTDTARIAELAPVLAGWGMDVRAVSEQIGVASAIKMCRSVMIKGLEALVIESYSTARAYGVESHVLPTLAEIFPGIDWEKQGAYFFSRVVQHGQRRAEEMRESAHTVREAGMEPLMASAIAAKQQWVADLAREGVFQGLPKDARWQDYADRLLESLPPPAAGD